MYIHYKIPTDGHPLSRLEALDQQELDEEFEKQQERLSEENEFQDHENLSK